MLGWFRMALWATSTDNVDGPLLGGLNWQLDWQLAVATWGSRGHEVQHGGRSLQTTSAKQMYKLRIGALVIWCLNGVF